MKPLLKLPNLSILYSDLKLKKWKKLSPPTLDAAFL